MIKEWDTKVTFVKTLAFIIILLIHCNFSQFAHADDQTMQSCLAQKLQSAPDSMTVGEIRSHCLKESTSKTAPSIADKKTQNAIEKRISTDRENILKPFTLMAHRQNYFFLGAHNLSGYSEKEYQEAFKDDSLEVDQTETQFQLSIKTPIAIDLFGTDIDLFAAYTVRSFWQLYNEDVSAPFRETNHEPEFWLQSPSSFDVFGFTNVANVFGIVHQSNGQSRNLSRSWNRIYADFIFHKGNLAFSIKPWIRIQEESIDDDNPDITDFLGHGQLTVAYKYNKNTFTLMSRNNLESGFSAGAVELGWSFPLFDYPYLKGYIEYFSGYGESLIDYDRYVNRVGLGILLTDLL